MKSPTKQTCPCCLDCSPQWLYSIKHIRSKRPIRASIRDTDAEETEAMQLEVVKQHTFYWSPEGRRLGTYTGTFKQAWKQFRKEFPQYARFKGEIYRTEKAVD